MEYGRDILNKLIDMYERRGAYDKEASSLRVIQIDVKKAYPAYADRYNHEAYKEINVSIEKLLAGGFVFAETNSTGQFTKVKLNVENENIRKCYRKLRREGIPEQCERVKKALDKFSAEAGRDAGCAGAGWDADCDGAGTPLISTLVSDWASLLEKHKKLPYDLKYDSRRVEEILKVIRAIISLEHETYIRNFSTALFKDSKKFQREFRKTVENILFDYTDEVVEKDKILEYYNLYENPTYVLIKGDATIRFEKSVIETAEMPDGIALSNASLGRIKSINVNTGKVITVENLTTYHDAGVEINAAEFDLSEESTLDAELSLGEKTSLSASNNNNSNIFDAYADSNAVYIYLGGYHNMSKQHLLEKIYADNKTCEYYHMGDLDVYGFLILENLKEKTGIPFNPLMMDMASIERFFAAGIYKELTATDEKLIKAKISTTLAMYKDVLQFMLDNNCKVEQESIKAVELLDRGFDHEG